MLKLQMILEELYLHVAMGIDAAVIQALHALVSSESDWEDSGDAIGNFAAQASLEMSVQQGRRCKRQWKWSWKVKP